MSTAPRFRRERPVQQYGTADLKHMTPEEIAAATDAGHLDALTDGRDPDATVDHRNGCAKPDVQREATSSIRLGDAVAYHCLTCGARKEI
ncbi:hypothetical protein [Streptomyces sp. NPDC085479]|uniref:hypothetical protein n=1 Tax=Streptomyces sp. NPDC085479 TaxID=3365726 RepID=UPI0037D67227